jgi:hypothetical protein
VQGGSGVAYRVSVRKQSKAPTTTLTHSRFCVCTDVGGKG